MERTIKLGEVDLQLRSSVFSIIEYRSVFGTELFSDIQKVESLKENPNEIGLFVNVIFKVLYILNRPYCKNKSYENFLYDFDLTILGDVETLKELVNVIGEMLIIKPKSVPQPIRQ